MAQLVVKVVDSMTGAPLPWVHVELDGRVNTTGNDGTVVFDVPPGTYTLKVRTLDYQPYTADVTVPGSVTVRLVRARF